MSKYEPLWAFLKQDGRPVIQLSFEEIEDILGLPLGHGFLGCKQEAQEYGYTVEKISLKYRWIRFLHL